MVAGLVNQRRSGQNKPLSAGLTAALCVSCLPATLYRLPVRRRASSK